MKNEKIFYQGSKGSYSESVLLELFPDYELVSCKTFQEVSKNTTQEGFGLLPVENSLVGTVIEACLLYTSPSPRDGLLSRMPSSA